MTDRLFILRIKDADALPEDDVKYVLDQIASEKPMIDVDLETGPEVVGYVSPTYGRHIYIEETG